MDGEKVKLHPRYYIDVDIVVSGDLSCDAVASVAAAVKYSNDVLFLKGVPVGTPRNEIGMITKHSVDGATIHVSFESGRYTTSTEAFLRFRKYLREVLGKHRIGIRDVNVPKCLIRLPENVPWDAIPKVKYLTAVYKDGDWHPWPSGPHRVIDWIE